MLPRLFQRLFRNCRRPATTFLSRLRRDRRGNTLALVAAMILPITGIIGSGLDMARVYLVKTRLQQACDSGVLAGRRQMAGTSTLSTAVTTEVQKYAQFNFPQQAMDTTVYTIAPTLDAANDTINLTLNTRMNTALMRLFGIASVPVQVTCSAREDYANIDIVLVLDTTGSMACKPERDDAGCSTYANQSGVRGQTMTVNGRTVTYLKEETSGGVNISRMQGLRTALSSLRDKMATIETQFASAPTAQRKRVRFAIVPFSQMTNPGFSTGAAGTTLYSRNPDWFNTQGTYKSIGVCGSGKNAYYCYKSASVSHNSSWMSSTWDGCVEERGTSNTITPTSGHSIPNNLPSNAYDLMFDSTPTTDTATRFTVADPDAVSEATTPQYACPKAMRELAPMLTSDYNSYFTFANGFVANGGTYLDLGMLWAARLLSRNGMWATDNPVTYNGFKVQRYVILMTDGVMDISNTGYGAYAQEGQWQRTTNDGSAATANANHGTRWLMTCSALKNNMATQIFVVSYSASSSLTADIQSCSSGAGYAFKADSSAQLNSVFNTIADNIGALRLSR
ncbi:pilus assembly protein [Sphingomonas sp. KR1UV-12]|uniref:Pilus assembly protein n=1 Tax=Sphingomonas aurea TaxID=3063994 RepID=A0ABT9EHX2_9SPHN|nr:TadE/TadG family type IV pilus assembly protein [Sphingomonas sp. KR1UV-12]MDP1026435.1 pilus assembly protein [Sphingomonas sp. KR1UV-12]